MEQSLLPLTEATFYILLSLSAGRKHGYAILKDISTLSGRITSYNVCYTKLLRTLSGDIHQIYFKAKKSYTITRDEWVAFHIELPWSIRKSKEKYSLFCEVLAETIRELLLSYDKLSKLHLNSAD